MPLMPPILTPVHDEGDNTDCTTDVCGLTVDIEHPGVAQVVDVGGHPPTVGQFLAYRSYWTLDSGQPEWPGSVLS